MPFSTDLPIPPAPLVPPDTDVSGLAGFMLNVDHLLASELVAIGSAEECWAALMLWCRAWKQVPAGSLPNDERVLASFSGAGRRWPKVREVALHGFVLCTDGRLYHRFLCQEVLRASARYTVYRDRRETDRKRLLEWRAKRRGNGDKTPSETRFVASDTIRYDKKEDSVPSSEDANASPEKATGADAPTETRFIEPVDPVKDLWDRGLAILGPKHRSLLGKMAKEYGQPAVLAAIVECEHEQPVDPVAYFVCCCEQKRRNGGGTPLANLFEGAWRAANERERREQERDRGTDSGPVDPLLEQH